MKLKFTNPYYPENIDQLTTIQKEQLLVVSKLYHGEEYPLEKLLCDEDDESYDEEITLFHLETWDVEDESGDIKYNFYLYMVDSGTLFESNTTNVIGEVIQFGFEDYSKEKISELLLNAQQEAKKFYKNNSLFSVDFS
ncbi:hypothetical protein JXR93_12750 [bacterium]|nr:hypothetical protein [bacterium]